MPFLDESLVTCLRCGTADVHLCAFVGASALLCWMALAHGWAVTDSEDELGSDELGDGLEAQSAPRPKKRGRPPGRKRTLAPAAIVAVSVPKSELNPVASGLSSVLADVPRVSGLDVLCDVLCAASMCPAADSHPLTDHLLGAGVRPCIGPTAEAAMLDEEVTNIARTLLQVAAAMHVGTLGLYASLLLRLHALFSSGALEPVMLLQWGTFDETPMVLREKLNKGADEGSGPAVSRQGKPLKILQSDFIVAILCAVRGADDSHEAFELMVLPVPLHLQSLDRATGPNLVQALDRVFSIPQLSSLRAAVPLVVDAYTGDRASANDCAVGQRSELLTRRDGFPSPTLRLPCFAHVGATAQGRSFGPVQREITGVIALALVMAGPGELVSLQRIMECVLASGTEVRRGTHVFAAEWADYRDSVLDLFVGRVDCISTPVGRERRRELGRLLCSNLASSSIILYSDAELSVHQWAKLVVRYVLPRPVPLFARHRWVAAYDPLAECGLLSACHDLLGRACVPWLQGQTTSKIKVPRVPVLCDWIVESEDEGGNEAAEAAEHLAIEDGAVDSEPEPDDQEEALVELTLRQQSGQVPKNTSKDPSKVMSEFNRKQRMKCLEFCQHPDSGHNLVLMRVAMTLCVTFLRGILVLASDAWQNRKHAGVVLGKPWSCRMLEAHKGELSAKIRSRASLLLHQDSGSTEWKAVPPMGRTFGSASKALSMVATAMCTLDFLAFTPWQGMPYAIWSLLSGLMACALGILMLPLCLLGSWARDLICNFVKPALSMTACAEILLGNRFRAVLVSLGAILRYDICALECRNAQIRRFAKHAQTWRNGFPEASARFLMMRHRVTRWRRHPPDAAAKPRRVRRRGRGLIGRSARAKARAKAVAKPKAHPKQRVRKKPQKTVRRTGIGKGGRQGGGGWHRAAVGDYLRGLRRLDPDDRAPLLEAANAYAREVWLAQDHRFRRYCELGEAETLRRRYGGKPLARKMNEGGQPKIRKRSFHESHPEWSFSGPFVTPGSGSVADPQMGLHLHEVQAWAEVQPKLRMQQSDLPAQAVPVVGPGLGAQSMDLRMVECKPPSQALLAATLDASAQALGSQGKLVEHWGVMHETVSHVTAPAPPPKKAKSKKSEVGNPKCLMSRRCVCCLGKDSLPLRLQAVLKSWFCKGGLGRRTYSQQGAVFCLSRAGIPDDCARWFFIGCGDLRYSWFITQELVPCSRSLALKELDAESFHVLECISSGARARPHPLFTLDVDSNVPWHVQLFGLQFESHELMVAFRPVALVRAMSDVLAFWSPGSKPLPRPARKKLVIKPLADVPVLVPLADILPGDNNLPAAQSEDAGQPGEDPVNDAASDAPASSESVASPRGVDGVGGVLDDSDAAADVGWEISDVSSDEDVDRGCYVCVLFFF